MKDELIKWIHLSDIHYMVDPSNERIHTKVSNAIREFTANRNEKVDCIIISGDFFQQGVFPENCTYSFEDVIQELCQMCLKDDLMDQWKERVLFCPGNHDLNRDAYYLPDTGHNILHRKDVLKIMRRDGQGQIEGNNDEFRLLTENSFTLFDREITELFRGKAKKFNEYTIFNIPDNRGTQVCFVGLNTSLSAGQIEDKEELGKKLAEARENFEKADSNLFSKDGYKDANACYKSYLKYHKQIFENQADDNKHLKFISGESVDAITKTINNRNGNYSAVVVFGHHPISAFSEAGKEAFGHVVLDEWKTKLYLCGHEHRPCVLKEKIHYNGQEIVEINEIKVGGNFSDTSSWNIPSFAISALYREEDTANQTYKISLEGDMVFRAKYCGDDGESEDPPIIADKPRFPDTSMETTDRNKDRILSHFINKDSVEDSWNRAWKAYRFNISDVGTREITFHGDGSPTNILNIQKKYGEEHDSPSPKTYSPNEMYLFTNPDIDKF